MTTMLIGLLLFLGAHALRIVAEDGRRQLIERHGEWVVKGVVALVSLLGLWLTVSGYQQARFSPVSLWAPPVAMRHLVLLLMWPAWVLMVASFVPGNRIKARLRHPMVLSVKVWSLAHLLANGQLHQILLFAAILVWAILSFRAARERDVGQPYRALARSLPATLAVLVLGTLVWAVFVWRVHLWLVGVSPLG